MFQHTHTHTHSHSRTCVWPCISVSHIKAIDSFPLPYDTVRLTHRNWTHHPLIQGEDQLCPTNNTTAQQGQRTHTPSFSTFSNAVVHTRSKNPQSMTRQTPWPAQNAPTVPHRGIESMMMRWWAESKKTRPSLQSKPLHHQPHEHTRATQMAVNYT